MRQSPPDHLESGAAKHLLGAEIGVVVAGAFTICPGVGFHRRRAMFSRVDHRGAYQSYGDAAPPMRLAHGRRGLPRPAHRQPGVSPGSGRFGSTHPGEPPRSSRPALRPRRPAGPVRAHGWQERSSPPADGDWRGPAPGSSRSWDSVRRGNIHQQPAPKFPLKTVPKSPAFSGFNALNSTAGRAAEANSGSFSERYEGASRSAPTSIQP